MLVHPCTSMLVHPCTSMLVRPRTSMPVRPCTESDDAYGMGCVNWVAVLIVR